MKKNRADVNGKNYSLRARLLRLIGVPAVLAGLAAGGLGLAFTFHETGEVYDAQLAQAARLLLQLTQHQIEEDESRGLVLGKEGGGLPPLYEKKMSFRIWMKDRLVAQSAGAGMFGPKPAPGGFSTYAAGRESWRVFALADDDNDLTVEVAENSDIRTGLILQVVLSLFIPGLFFLPVLLWLVWRGASRGLRPVEELARQVNLRGGQDLTPLETEGIAAEILPFAGALNRLLLRLGETLQLEREFTDNAAHELRTPLAAMKTQAQVLRKTAVLPPGTSGGLADLQASVDRAVHLVDQLLVFARLQNANDAFERVNLSALAEESLRGMFPPLDEKGQSLDVRVEQGLTLQGSAHALGLLVRNLVDNASKYSPPGSRIAVSVARADGKTVLAVRDQGPGIPEELQERVFDRFYRADKSGETGSGLGLAIVKWIADMHRAEIRLANVPSGGLSAAVYFPD